jgi:hypothetical protein
VSSAVILFAIAPPYSMDASGALPGSLELERHDRLAADEALRGVDVSEEALDKAVTQHKRLSADGSRSQQGLSIE